MRNRAPYMCVTSTNTSIKTTLRTVAIVRIVADNRIMMSKTVGFVDALPSF